MSDALPTATRVADPGLRALYAQERRWQAWLDVEAALARAQEELGIIPKGAAAAIGKAARIELHRSHVNVLTVCPGFVRTDFAANMVMGEQQRRSGRKPHGITADRVARATLKGYLRNRREVIVPWTMIPVVKIYQLFPGMVEWTMRRLR